MSEKNSFILYFGYRKHLQLLSDEECGQLLRALFDYAEGGKIPKLNGAIAMAFSFIQDQMDRDAKKYAAKCEQNRENGTRGGRPPKMQESQDNPPKPKITERFSEKPKKPDNDYEYGNDSENDNGNEDDITPPLPPAGGSAGPVINHQTERFDEFWKAYPKKVGKEAARKSWMRIKPSADLHEKIMFAISNAKRSDQWRGENGRFIPNPATWLNQGRWDDELDISNGKAKNVSFADIARKSSNPFMDELETENKGFTLFGFKE